MDGLIPMVLKAIKNKKTRSRYECLSEGGAAPLSQLDDLSLDRDRNVPMFHTPQPEKKTGLWEETVGSGGRLRRVMTLGGEYGSSPMVRENKQMVRSGTHRRMLSCFTGA